MTGAGEPQPFALVALSPAVSKLRRPELETQLAARRAEINDKLDHHERLSRIVVIDEKWNVDNGMLTPTLKVHRAAIEGHYAREFQAYQVAGGPVVWAPARSRQLATFRPWT